ncbi:hypothetical protein L7F22_034965 [Adiantum nelumboides]|nr:hypothetical protein [Adiantum nelumboides]
MLSSSLILELSCRYYGPFQILRPINKTAYQLKLPSHWPIHNALHVSLLKAYKGDPPQEPVLDDPLDFEGPDEILQPKDIIRHEDKEYAMVRIWILDLVRDSNFLFSRSLVQVAVFWSGSVQQISGSGFGPSTGTQGSATQDPHIATSDSSSDFDVMEGYPMQQHPESSSQDMHALGQQPGVSMFSRLKETLSRATRSEHATNEINEGGREVDLLFTSQIDPVLSESVHVSTLATTPIGFSKLTSSETLLPDGRSLAEVQEVERYILAAREKEIESLRKAEQRRATLAKALMTSVNPLQSPELITLKSQPKGSHIASGSKDTPNASILDGVFLNENWEYNLQTEKLTDLYTSYTYHVGWLDVIQATSNSTSVDEQQRMICDVIHSIVQMERQNLGINMPSMGPMRFLDTTKAKQPTISQMETPSVSPMDSSYIVSPGVSMQSEPTHGSFSFPDLVQPSLGDLPTPTMNMTGNANSTSLASTTPLHTSVAPMPIPVGVHQPYVPVATHPYVAPMPPPNPIAYVPQSHYPSPYFSGDVPAAINTSYPTSAMPEPTSTSLGAVPYEVWDPRRVRMPRPKPANPFPYVVPRVPTRIASTPIVPTHLGDLAAFAQTIDRSIVENMHNLPDREPRSKAVQVAKIAQKYNGAIFLQQDPHNSRMMLVYFASRVTDVNEKGYSEAELMMLALMFAVRKLRSYLLPKPFVILTIENLLPWVSSQMSLSPRITKWLMELQGYEYTFKVEDSVRAQLANILTYRMHEKIIKVPNVKSLLPPPAKIVLDAYTLFFDGAFRRATGKAEGGLILCLMVKGDALLIVKQILGIWACKNERLRFGTPLENFFVNGPTDNGLGFRKRLLTEVCEELKIQHRDSTPYFPQSNGLVEKANGIIAGIIRKMVQSKPKLWDAFLDEALWTYRTTYKDATQFTPLHLEALQSIELQIPTINLVGKEEQGDNKTWINRFLTLIELEWKRESAYRCYERKAFQLKEKLDERIKDKGIKEKSLVLCDTTLSYTTRLMPNWKINGKDSSL